MTKVSSFSAAVIVVAVSPNNEELRKFVSKDLFSAAIQGFDP